MRVHKDFKKFCDKIKEVTPNITGVEITNLMVKHNSIEIIKGAIIDLKNEG